MTGKELNELATEYLTKKDYDKARQYFEEASEQGEYLAMYNLACMYYFGDGVEKDDVKAYFWYEKAWRHGDSEAANRVAVMREMGIGTEQNQEEAFKAYLESARMGSLSGMANAGRCYLEGIGTEADIQAGLDWMTKAFEGGNGIASLNMGEYCFEGKYMEQSYEMARLFWERGAAQKYDPCTERLSYLYENGLCAKEK